MNVLRSTLTGVLTVRVFAAASSDDVENDVWEGVYHSALEGHNVPDGETRSAIRRELV